MQALQFVLSNCQRFKSKSYNFRANFKSDMSKVTRICLCSEQNNTWGQLKEVYSDSEKLRNIKSQAEK